ncbi:jacalin-related lectin 3-like [Cornus florida]|uniref:jacalin-related lectin 3-like n=1 Tax=Cornus florida TaxID=4283 RepID=UPI00289AFF1B|nr:jacalin-related lectin 3-like [Cornus florida]
MANGQIVTFGTYGGPGGKSWDDGTYNTIRELIIYSAWDIDSIQVIYDVEGKPVSGERHGGDGGNENRVKLDYPSEYLVSISGYYGYNSSKIFIVRSLTLQSNVKQYGPYGTKNGTPFISPLTVGKIVGFFGRESSRLDSIGIYNQPFHATTPMGPFGGDGGKLWDDGTYNSMVRQIIINSGWNIDSIQVDYVDIEGKSISGKRHGGDGGTAHTVKLDYPGEYLISISGYYGSNSSRSLVVKSLTLKSNIKQYGPYGKEEGTRFITPLAAGKIVGFFGREGDRLESIGVYIKPFQTVIPVGPFGTTAGQEWDDGTYNTIRELIIHSGAVIDSIQVVYDDIEGKPISGEKHGTDGGQQNTLDKAHDIYKKYSSNDLPNVRGTKSGTKAMVKLDYPDEFLLSIWGYYGTFGNKVCIRSLGFQSNKRTIGPFGVEEGEKFQSPSTRGKIIGFYGRFDQFLTSIGTYLDK